MRATIDDPVTAGKAAIRIPTAHRLQIRDIRVE
jgi:hypothetical protein